MVVDLRNAVRIEEPAFYDEGNADVLRRLRAEAPVFRYEPLDMWVLSRYDDIKYVERTPQLFTVTDGKLINSAKFGGPVERDFFDDGADLLATLDPPRHGEVRRVIAPAFTPKAIARLETAVRDTTRRQLAPVEPGIPIDVVRDIARVVPTKAVGTLLGIPEDEVSLDELVFWTGELNKLGAPLSRAELDQAARTVQEMRKYLLDLLDRRKKEPADDLLTRLVTAEAERPEITAANILMLAMVVFLAGIDTTRNSLAGLLWCLARHPAEMGALAADHGLVDQAVQESLRWVTPVPGFVRRATTDTEIRGTRIAKGDWLYLLYYAANRDEQYWSDPDTFDITRPTTHGVLSFGFGNHVCIGEALARLELRVVLQELLARFSTVALAGTPTRIDSHMQHGWDTLPLTFGTGSSRPA
ncbi:cytochrome P450 [Pseudonocardia sp. CA-107938]|uniref:cytochrome P450 n=1 Tax=Pseudonocardia sp. CA-107938 TaxID=3240021 RepID=UPI003D900122